MNRISTAKQTQIIAALVEGNSIRATCRMTGAAKGTVLSLLGRVGDACYEYQNEKLIKLDCKRIQCDEIWSFCYAKEKNVPKDRKGEFGFGDVYTWVAIDADTKLVITYCVGKRDAKFAVMFMKDVAFRMKHRVQLTTDGHTPYLKAVKGSFGLSVDYAMLVKLYGGGDEKDEKRYSPAVCTGALKKSIVGVPDEKHISTSYVKRQNLTMRMSMRRFTRLTNAFSKKIENHECAIALHFMYYNFCRPHQSLKNPYPRTPAMAAGVENRVWSISDILQLLEVSN